MYNVYLWLIGKCIVDYLLLPIGVNSTFLLGFTAEALQAKID